MSSAAQELTSAHCRAVAASLRRSLAELNEELPAGSPLARLLIEVDWMGSFSGPPRDPKTGASSENPERVANAFLRFLQLEDVARSLHALGPTARENPEALKALRRDHDRIKTQRADAQNRLFELEVAGRLVRGGARVRFDEPDIVASATPFGRFLACKRPQNLDRLRERIVEGARQIERRAIAGFVVVDLQPLLFKNDASDRPTRFYDLRGTAELRDELAADMDGRIAVVADAVARARAVHHVRGVAFAATGWGIHDEGSEPQYAWAWVTRPAMPDNDAERQLCRLLSPQHA